MGKFEKLYKSLKINNSINESKLTDEELAYKERIDKRTDELEDIKTSITTAIGSLNSILSNIDKYKDIQAVEDKEASIYSTLSRDTGVDFLKLLTK